MSANSVNENTNIGGSLGGEPSLNRRPLAEVRALAGPDRGRLAPSHSRARSNSWDDDGVETKVDPVRWQNKTDLTAWLESNFPKPRPDNLPAGGIKYYEGPTGDVGNFTITLDDGEQPDFVVHKPIGINTVGPKGWMVSATGTLDRLKQAGKADIKSKPDASWERVTVISGTLGITTQRNGVVYYTGGNNRAETLNFATAAAKAKFKLAHAAESAALDTWNALGKGRDIKKGKRPTVNKFDPSSSLAELSEHERNAEAAIEEIGKHLKRSMPDPVYTMADITTLQAGSQTQVAIPSLFDKTKDQAMGIVRRTIFLALVATPNAGAAAVVVPAP